MNPFHRARRPGLIALLAIALPLALAGCGNKGPLVMAAPPADIESETPAGRVPVEIAAPQPVAAAGESGAIAPAASDDAGTSPADDEPADRPIDPRIPIDPATVPGGSGSDDPIETPPADGTADDGNG